MIFGISALWIYGSSSWETEVICVFDSTVEASDRSDTIFCLKLPTSTIHSSSTLHQVVGEASDFQVSYSYFVIAFFPFDCYLLFPFEHNVHMAFYIHRPFSNHSHIPTKVKAVDNGTEVRQQLSSSTGSEDEGNNSR